MEAAAPGDDPVNETAPQGRSVLLVDDDEPLCRMLEEYLADEGFTAAAAHDGASGLDMAATGDFDIVVLDVMLPVFDGFEVLRRLRTASRVPVIMLTAMGNDVDRIVGLEIGADDYLTKPFNPRELVARLRAILRRADAPETPSGTVTADTPAGRLQLDPKSLSAQLGQRDLELTSAEFRTLKCLAEHAGEVVSREELTRQALGRRLGAYDRAIDTHISNLRKKLGPAPENAVVIRSVRNAGYLLVMPRAGA
jgi:two-component system response regulator CpxR